MSGFYEALRDGTATPLIEEYGAEITLVRPWDSSDYDCEYDAELMREVCYDTDTGAEVTPGADQEFTGSAVVDNYSKALIDGTAVQAGDRRMLCVGIPEPSAGVDAIKLDGATYQVVSVDPLSPGGVAVLYEVQVR